MRTNQAVRAKNNLVEKPDRIGPALAQVIHVAADGDIILGQAWLAGPNQMVTCGHVVEQFAQDVTGLFMYFPSSGKRYPVQKVRLHPSYVRQPDGLVRFDAAVVTVQLTPPDSLALPLPITFENPIDVNERLWTIRYPAHLGQFSAAMLPLSQDGRFLGLLRKHDSFHLLHDVPLAPGDSGAPITDGKNIVAMHCGDTATIPGLNLPTTSIRLALWVDALQDLGIQPSRRKYVDRATTIIPAIIAFAVAAVIACGTVSLVEGKKAPPKADPSFAKNEVPPLRVQFNRPISSFKPGDDIKLTLEPSKQCYPYVFSTTEGTVFKLFPQQKVKEKVAAKQQVVIDGLIDPNGKHETIAMSKVDTGIYVVAFAADGPDPEPGQWADSFMGPDVWTPGNLPLLKLQEPAFVQRIEDYAKQHPKSVFFHKITLLGTKQDFPGDPD